MFIETLLVSAFPGAGKSYYFNNVTSEHPILDSDSSTFDKTMFPENYMRHIISNIGRAEIIFISSHDVVRQSLLDHDLHFVLCYPDMHLKTEYIQRYKDRGSNEAFVQLLEENWEEWITELQNQKGCTHLVLQEGQYLSDVLFQE